MAFSTGGRASMSFVRNGARWSLEGLPQPERTWLP